MDFGIGKTESFDAIYIAVNNAWITIYIESKIHYKRTVLQFSFKNHV